MYRARVFAPDHVALVVEDEDCLLPVGPETRQHVRAVGRDRHTPSRGLVVRPDDVALNIVAYCSPVGPDHYCAIVSTDCYIEWRAVDVTGPEHAACIVVEIQGPILSIGTTSYREISSITRHCETVDPIRDCRRVPHDRGLAVEEEDFVRRISASGIIVSHCDVGLV